MKPTLFGTMPGGEPVYLYRLAGANGLTVDISNYGGIVTAIRVPDRDGRIADVALGFNSLGAYLQGHPYFGAITGRVAGRITHGRFELDGRGYQLAINDPPNHLHGGVVGLDKRLWHADAAPDGTRLKLSYFSPNGEEGYPGNVHLAVEYTVTENQELYIDYTATTDRPTLVNLTNHTYFNLAGEGAGDIRDHQLTILADRYAPSDDQLTLTGESRAVEEGANDFRAAARIGDRLGGLLRQHGDNYLLWRSGGALTLAARLLEPVSGRALEVLTTEPCLQFYTGKFLDGSLIGKSGRAYGSHAGLCLECQGFPEAVGRPEFDPIELRPGETYRQTTIYRFATEQRGVPAMAEPAARSAGFSVEEGGNHFWIRDGGRRVLLFVRMPAGGFFCNAVFLQQPGEPAPEFPESYHSATAIGLQLDIRWRWGLGWQPMERATLEVGTESAVIGFTRYTATRRNEQRIELSLRRSGSGPTDYVLHCHSVLLADTPAGQSIEFLNFLPADAGNSWPDRKRFRATIHEIAPGQYERRPHSPLTVIEPYYWPDGTHFRRPHMKEPPFAEVFDSAFRAQGAAAPFAVSHLYKPMAQGGVLYFAGEAVTPAVRVVRSNTPVVLHTCDVWYDEHICLERGVVQADGRYLYEVEYEIFRLADAAAQRGEAGSRNTVASAWTTAHGFAPFFCDRVNTFAAPAGHEHDGSTGLFFAYENPAHLVSWQRQTDLPGRGALVLNNVDPVEPPSGQYYQSVRYDLGGATPWVEAFPLGFSLHVARDETVEFSALIKVEGEAEAWLEMREAFWGKFQREHQGDSELQVAKAGAVNSREWTRVTGRLTARIPGSLSMIFLAMRGRGRASFAELEVRRSKEPPLGVSPSARRLGGN